MGFPPQDKTFEGVLRDMNVRLDLIERRLSGAGSGTSVGSGAYGVLDPNYRMGGPAKVKVGSDTALSGPYGWRVPYVPNGSRQVSLAWTGSTWEIAGQPDSTPTGGFVPLVLSSKFNGYTTHQLDASWNERIGATRLPTGLIVLSGLLRNDQDTVANEVIATLPPKYRPEYTVIVSVSWNDVHRPLQITPNGDIYFRANIVPAGGYTSLDGIAFWAAESEATGNWVNIGTGGTSFAAGFTNLPAWDGVHGHPAVYTDRYGFVWGRGLVQITAAQSVGNTPMINLPTASRAHMQQHFRTTANEGFALIGSRPEGGGIDWKPPTPGTVGSWVSLYGFAITTPAAATGNAWATPYVYKNNWHRYSAAFPDMGWVRRGDGVVMMRGLVSSGTDKTAITALSGYPEVYPHARRVIISTVSAEAPARVDIRGEQWDQSDGPGEIVARGGTSPTWIAFDSMMYVP